MCNEIYSGYYVPENLLVIVSDGIGFTLTPVRYRAPGEVVQIRLKSIEN